MWQRRERRSWHSGQDRASELPPSVNWSRASNKRRSRRDWIEGKTAAIQVKRGRLVAPPLLCLVLGVAYISLTVTGVVVPVRVMAPRPANLPTGQGNPVAEGNS